MTSRMRAVVVGFALAMSFTGTASAQNLFSKCPSEPIQERFAEFGKTGKMPSDLRRWLNTPEAQYIEPWSAFDNVDYVGVCWVSAWLVHTGEGTVLIDTLYGPFEQTLIDNIEATGTDFADIRYVLMTHGHFDHVGGAAALEPLLPNARFVMTRKGWDEARESAAASTGGPRACEMMAPDMVVADGDEITLGGNVFKVLETPGHTWGTASYTFDVEDGDNTHRAITIGGLGLNAIEGPDQVEAYVASLDRIRALVEAPDGGIDVHLTTHGFSNHLSEDRRRLQARKPGEPNVLVNPEGLLRQIDFLRKRALARLKDETTK